VIGGLVGGVMVSALGVFGAIAFDAASFVVAALLTARIKANTTPKRADGQMEINSFARWRGELKTGIGLLVRVPVLLWSSAFIMLLNFAMSPLTVVLAVFAKESRGMPAWFLGALQSSVGLGAVVGALCIAFLQRRLRASLFMVLSVALMGACVILLPLTSDSVLPVALTAVFGAATAWTNIPLSAQFALTVPDAFRARIGSVTGFVVQAVSPLGVAVAGMLVAEAGVTTALFLLGAALVVMAPLLLLIPKIHSFLGCPPQGAEGFFGRHYPGVFPDQATGAFSGQNGAQGSNREGPSWSQRA
jgi:predicted MFS family arabinose efflux permease